MLDETQARNEIQDRLNRGLPKIPGLYHDVAIKRSAEGPRGDVAYALHFPDQNRLVYVVMHISGGTIPQMELLGGVQETIESGLRNDGSLTDVLVEANDQLRKLRGSPPSPDAAPDDVQHMLFTSYVEATLAELYLEPESDGDMPPYINLTIASAGDGRSLIYTGGFSGGIYAGNEGSGCSTEDLLPHKTTGLALGLADNGTFEHELTESEVCLSRGAIFIAYTKGTSLPATAGFEENELVRTIVDACQSFNAQEINRRIMDSLKTLEPQSGYDMALLTARLG